MKLLILTQKIDRKDPALGFFHDWVIELAKKFHKISVICLERGEYDLPNNVNVYSLGKESGKSKIKYVKNFLNLILGLHKEYDAVFVHMNQEYVVLGGFLWKIMRKKVFLWRNHPKGNTFTRIAVWFSDKVFCTSKFAFVAKYRKTRLMPVGIEIEKFKDLKIKRFKNSILFLGRIAPIKRPDLLIEALNILDKNRSDFTCDFYGDALPRDENYYNYLKTKTKEYGLDTKVNFYKSMPNHETPKIYNQYEIFVNLTPTGSFDKTILEAAACGCIPIMANKSLVGEIDERVILQNELPEHIADRINLWLNANAEDKTQLFGQIQKLIHQKHDLNILVNKLAIETDEN